MSESGSVLITGGAGYIGSAVAYACAAAGYDPVVLDDLSHGRKEQVAGFPCYVGDVGDRTLVRKILEEHRIGAVVHCAGRIDVVESFREPRSYYEHNVAAMIGLLDALSDSPDLVFLLSSSASVYGPWASTPIDELSPPAPASPYARTKLIQEQLLSDVAAGGGLQVIILRYFNPIGADEQGRFGPSPYHDGTALMMMLAAAHSGEPFEVFGTDYPTRDGSPERDFIDVRDLADAHVAGLQQARAGAPQVINLGTGCGVTVMELAQTVHQVTGHRVNLVASGERPGDIPVSYADVRQAREVLGFRATRSLEESVATSWSWYLRRHGPAR